MMSGVEILATEEVAIAWEGFNWHNFWMVVIGTICLTLIFSIIIGLIERDFESALVAFITVTTAVSAIVGTTVGVYTAEPTEYKTQYKVTIDETVSMLEFNEKYEIIDQDGKIYIVEEKEN